MQLNKADYIVYTFLIPILLKDWLYSKMRL